MLSCVLALTASEQDLTPHRGLIGIHCPLIVTGVILPSSHYQTPVQPILLSLVKSLYCIYNSILTPNLCPRFSCIVTPGTRWEQVGAGGSRCDVGVALGLAVSCK